MNKKEKLICIGFLLIMGIISVGALTTNEIDIVCDTDNSILKRIGGTWQCSVTNYAEMYIQNYTNPKVISIASNETYVIIEGFTAGESQGTTINGNNFTIEKDGTYKAEYTMGFSGGNAGDYEAEMTVNAATQKHCSLHRTTSNNAIGDATLSCIMTLTTGDQVCIMIEDLTSPAQDIEIVSANFAIIEIQ